jgi:hypothetical protein
LVSKLPLESVVQVTGTVQQRPKGQINEVKLLICDASHILCIKYIVVFLKMFGIVLHVHQGSNGAGIEYRSIVVSSGIIERCYGIVA